MAIQLFRDADVVERSQKRQTDSQPERQPAKQTSKQADSRAGEQAERLIDRHPLTTFRVNALARLEDVGSTVKSWDPQAVRHERFFKMSSNQSGRSHAHQCKAGVESFPVLEKR